MFWGRTGGREKELLLFVNCFSPILPTSAKCFTWPDVVFWAENHCSGLKDVAGLPQLDTGVTTSSRHMSRRSCSKTCGVSQSLRRSQPFAVSGGGAAGGDSSGAEGPLHCVRCRHRSTLCLLCWRSIQKAVWHHSGTCQWTSLEPSRVWEMLGGDWS